jgi:archaetidylinositol phosphate synthase
MLAEKRTNFKILEELLGKIFSKLNLHPNHYTLFSIFFGFLCFLFLFYKNLALAFFSFLIAIFLDLIDGAVARHSNKVTKTGAFLDTISDRFVEGLIFLGFLSLSLPKFFLEAKYWIFLAFFGSLMTTYAKAAAKEKELVAQELKKGFLGRGERMILLSITFLLGILNQGLMIYPISLLAVLSNLTAIQRIILALK